MSESKHFLKFKDAYVTCVCKTCGKEFHRKSRFKLSREYCSYGCEKGTSLRKHVSLTQGQVDEIRNLYAIGQTTYRALGEKYGVSHNAIAMIVKHKLWKKDP